MLRSHMTILSEWDTGSNSVIGWPSPELTNLTKRPHKPNVPSLTIPNERRQRQISPLPSRRTFGVIPYGIEIVNARKMRQNRTLPDDLNSGSRGHSCSI